MTFAIPQTRGTGFYPKALERGMRSERAMALFMAEMYVQGVSTRKVKDIMEKLCGLEVSSSQVSDAAKAIDADIRAFRERPLGRFPVLYADAEYQRVRIDEAVRHWADTRKHPAFAEWLEGNAEEAMAFFDFDARWWSRIRTSNCIERLNKEIKRRTKVVGIFPNVASCERLVGAILMEKHEEWMYGKVYLNEGKEGFSASCE